MDAAESMKVGDVTTVTVSSGGIWIIKKYDINEKESFYTDVKEDIRANMTNTKFNTLLKQWETELSYSFNNTVKDKYLDPNARDSVFVSK